MDWLINIFTSVGKWFARSTDQINGLTESISSSTYIKSNLVIQGIGNIHFIAGDIIFYELLSLISIGIAIVFVNLFIAILRIIKDIKQTALF